MRGRPTGILVRGAISLVVVLAALEIALRAFGPFLPGAYRTGPLIEIDTDLGWRHVPSSITWYRTREFTSRVEVGPDGRVGPSIGREREGATRRILVLGDSFAEAAQVRYADGMPSRLASLLQDIRLEVVNDAVSAYGTDQALLLLERELPIVRPDLAVLVFSVSTDVWDNYMPFSSRRPTKAKPYFRFTPSGELELTRLPPSADPVESLRGFLARSNALSALKSGIIDALFDRGAGSARREQLAVLAPPSDEWEAAWRLTEKLLERTAAVARGHGVPLLLVLAPDGCQVDARACGGRPELAYSDLPQARLRALATMLSVRVVDPLEAMRQRARSGVALYFLEDLHWTPQGHEVVAEVVAGAVREMLR